MKHHFQIVQNHWHGPFNTVVTDLFSTAVNVPLRDSSLQNGYAISLSLKSAFNLQNIFGKIVVIFSVWYLSFYCNPRIQFSVVSKILVDGLLATASLYGDYMEQYVYCEEEINEDEKEEMMKKEQRKDGEDQEEVKPNASSYNVSSVLSVVGWQLLYSLLTPINMFKEIGAAGKMSSVRDFGGRGNDKVTPIQPIPKQPVHTIAFE